MGVRIVATDGSPVPEAAQLPNGHYGHRSLGPLSRVLANLAPYRKGDLLSALTRAGFQNGQLRQFGKGRLFSDRLPDGLLAGRHSACWNPRTGNAPIFE